MSGATHFSDIPSWDGDASSFEAFVIACRWFQKSLKESEQKQAASKIWQRLQGPAKAVVKHLSPEAYEDVGGLDRLLDVLRQSPLQQLPIPDSFSRLEAWHHLRRQDRESIPELLIREEDLFTQLQQALQRARKDRTTNGPEASSTNEMPRIDPSASPTRSPMPGVERVWNSRRNEGFGTTPATPTTTLPGNTATGTSDFFENEMRGYRLLKASRLSTQEKQYILTQTGNSTHFLQIKHALRTLFADENDRRSPEARRTGKVWWHEDDWEHDDPDSFGAEFVDYYDWSPGSWEAWYPEEETYWADDWYGDWADEESWNDNAVDDAIQPDESSNLPEESQLREAFALAGEANRTLKEAREAVKRVRESRGYFSPESNSGKGFSPKGMKSSGKGKKSYGGKSGSSHGSDRGPCVICGKPDHNHFRCPDRFSQGQKGKSFSKSKGKSKGKFGKSKNKPKGQTYYYDYMQCVAANWDEDEPDSRKSTRIIVDTGATENAVGINALYDLVSSGNFTYDVQTGDMPTFKFGNGHRDRAVSKVNLVGTSLGDLSLYVLGGMASNTPPLLGARTLKSKHALLSYATGVFTCKHGDSDDKLHAVMMQPLKSGHVTIDLTEQPTEISWDQSVKQAWSSLLEIPNRDTNTSGSTFMAESVDSRSTEFYIPLNVHFIGVLNRVVDDTMNLQHLAHQVEDLRNRIRCGTHGTVEAGGKGRSSVGINRSGRPQTCGMAMLGRSQGTQGEVQPTCSLVGVPPLRVSHELCDQEDRSRANESNGPRAEHHSVGIDRVGEDARSTDNDRGHGQWEGHGDQRKNAPDGHSNKPFVDHDVPGVCEQTQGLGPVVVHPATQQTVDVLEEAIKRDLTSPTKSGKGYSKQTVKTEKEVAAIPDDVMSINSSTEGGDHGKGSGEL